MVEKATSVPITDLRIAKEGGRPSHSGLPDSGILNPHDMPITFEKKQPLIDRAVGALAQALDDLLTT